MNIKEGQVANYSVLAIKKIDEDGEDFFVLKHPAGGKFLLPYSPYKQYNIEIGATIKCRVDKISCSGKIYLEPEHPCYMEGSYYDFKLVSTTIIMLSTGDTVDAAIVEDCFFNKVEVVATGVNLSDNVLNCRVDYIRKGNIYLSVYNANGKQCDIKAGESYQFTITGQIKHENNLYYIVEAPDKSKHTINCKYYQKYGLEKEKSFIGEVSKLSKRGNYLIEPKHPIYQVGEIYSFEVIEIISFQREEDFKVISRVIILDKLGEKASIDWPKNKDYPVVGSYIQSKVLGFRKGKLILEENKVD